MALHSTCPLGQNHKVHNFEVADEAARLALTVTSEDLDKIAKQLDDNSYWILTSISPKTWTFFGGTFQGENIVLDSFTNYIHADGLHIKVRNSSGSLIPYGSLVYLSGYHVGSETPEVGLSHADNAATMPAVGMVTEAGGLPNNTSGQVTVYGIVDGLDTSAFSVGDAVYVSETAGEFSIRPTASTSLVQKIGVVYRSNASNGVLSLMGASRTNDVPNNIADYIPQQKKIVTKTSDYTVLSTDYTVLVEPSTVDIVITLPSHAAAFDTPGSLGQVVNISQDSASYGTVVKDSLGAVVGQIPKEGGVLNLQTNGTKWIRWA